MNARETTPSGRQTASRKISAPSPSAIAAYWTPRATDSALLVIEPLLPPPASSSSSDSEGGAASPTVNTNPLETGWPSAETTRNVAV